MMPWLLKRLLLRLRATFSARQDRDTQAELDLHLRLLEEEHVAKGMAPDAAQRLSRREFGNPAVFQDASRDLFSFHPIEDLIRDLCYAGREMRRSAGFTVIAVGSLAVGIGAATATFAVTEAVMLRPLTVRSPAHLVAFTTAADSGWATWSYAALARWQRLPASGGLYEVAAASDVRPFRSARGSGESPEEVRVSLVSHNYFDAIGARVVLGRPFAARDTPAPGTGTVAIVSDGFWRRRFGGAPDVLARTIELGGVQFAVVGVTESGFTGHSVGHPVDVWVPLTMQPTLLPGMGGLDESARAERRWLKIVGHLADGASVERAEGAARVARQVFLAEKAARLGADQPEVARDRTESFRLVAGATGDGAVRAQFAPALTLLTVITSLVLVVACTNFTNLMFARAEARRREFLIRLAIGAGRWRLIRQSAAESLALAAMAGVLALLFASWATSMAMSLVSVLEPLEPLEFAIELNTRVMAFAGACVFTAALFGLWPCLRLVRSTVISSVHHRTAAAGARPVAHRLMLIGQLVVCAILMFGAGLLLKTVINLRTQDLGYERDVLLMPLEAERPGRPPDAASALVEDLRQRIATIPGVQAVGVFGSALLDSGAYWVDGSERLRTDRGEAAAGTRWTSAFAGPGFFDAVGMRAVQGRPLSEAGQAGEVAINESLARALFGNADPIGRQLGMNPKEPMLIIVGVMKDARQISPRDRGIGVAYLPIRRYGRVTLAVRLASPSLAQAASVRQRAQTILGHFQAAPISTISEELERSIARERLTSGIALFLAVLVVVIGCIGIYALMTYDVTRRQREFGVRLALGATAGGLVTTVLRDGATILGPALAIGIPAGLATTRLLASQLYGVDARDPWTLSSVAVLLSVVVMGAALRPARLASRIDPMVLLRHD
jgi:predicted permease